MVLCLKARKSRSLPGQLRPELPLTMANGYRARRSIGTVFSFDAGWSSPVARQAHNLKVAGSNPAPATNKIKDLAAMLGPFSFQALENCRENCRVKLAKSTFLSPTLRVPWDPIGLVGTAKSKSAPPLRDMRLAIWGGVFPSYTGPRNRKPFPGNIDQRFCPSRSANHTPVHPLRGRGPEDLAIAPDGPTCLGSL